MAVTAESQSVLVHKWQGIASSAMGATSIIFNLLLVAIAMSGTEPSRSATIALQVLAVVMLCANLAGIALGVLGARDGSSRKLYPRLGLGSNLAVVTVLVALAIAGLSAETP
jgi:hypothetical protein